ncbi:hypothetical protein LTR56_018264 [Elasticomyces elasticus]|nr:hypothetical protein LTR56_018264 [Elasticomyces elasticus]KAK3636755.1 hypothetical protein LTR22_018569 [Elasticomyces elasticus]KAK4912381.1 hypothetical protein LTR49_019200 [Elasticomyces elasticus]KAK5751824.1 hypothetical protein LTS12_018064 [Elasticomyces elasticus]
MTSHVLDDASTGSSRAQKRAELGYSRRSRGDGHERAEAYATKNMLDGLDTPLNNLAVLWRRRKVSQPQIRAYSDFVDASPDHTPVFGHPGIEGAFKADRYSVTRWIQVYGRRHNDL